MGWVLRGEGRTTGRASNNDSTGDRKAGACVGGPEDATVRATEAGRFARAKHHPSRSDSLIHRSLQSGGLRDRNSAQPVPDRERARPI